MIKDINNQKEYWNKVAGFKTFTHPLDAELLEKYFFKSDKLLDYGCGYGRITAELYRYGFTNITGVDTSVELIKRGKINNVDLNLRVIENSNTLPFENGSFDAVILFAVLTCIPLNEGQKKLVASLYSKLATGGRIYISDYYLQENREEVNAYENYNNDAKNYGVFSLEEGATFRHHTKAWIKELFKDFEFIKEKEIEVKTMNGHVAKAFQLIIKKIVHP
ncbi:MAG: methyltransferase domain-containing protein [Bacteroidota bacterium]